MTKFFRAIALILAFAALRAAAATVGWSATSGVGTLTDLSGTAVPLNSALIMIGTFQPTLGTGPSGADATIKNLFANGNITTIMNDFTQFNTTTRLAGRTGFGAGQWSYSDINSAAVFANQQVYMLAFNTTSVGTATQMGIFTGAYGAFASEWSFPADTSLGSVNPELGDTTASGVIVGTLSGIKYKMSVIPVPEPSSVALCAVAAFFAATARKRKRG